MWFHSSLLLPVILQVHGFLYLLMLTTAISFESGRMKNFMKSVAEMYSLFPVKKTSYCWVHHSDGVCIVTRQGVKGPLMAGLY